LTMEGHGTPPAMGHGGLIRRRANPLRLQPHRAVAVRHFGFHHSGIQDLVVITAVTGRVDDVADVTRPVGREDGLAGLGKPQYGHQKDQSSLYHNTHSDCYALLIRTSPGPSCPNTSSSCCLMNYFYRCVI